MIIEVALSDNSDRFGRPLAELFRVISIIKNVEDLNEEIVIDLSECRFSNPFMLGGLVMLQKSYQQKGYNVRFNQQFRYPSFTAYMGHILFPGCIDPLSLPDEDYEDFFQKYSSKNFIPLTKYPGNLSIDEANKRERFITGINNLIIARCHLDGNIAQAIRYIISESLDNIIEHSQSEFSIVFAQFYPTKGYFDLFISDSGIGFLGAYQQFPERFPNVATHHNAMQRAIQGQSVKGENRGFGLRTSKNMLVNGLNGKYFLMSGDTFYFHDRQQERIGAVAGSPVDGVMLSLRIPIAGNHAFNYTDFLE